MSRFHLTGSQARQSGGMADTHDSKSCAARHVGSTPTSGTKGYNTIMPIQKVTLTEKDLSRIFRRDTRATKFWRGTKRLFAQLLALGILFGIFFVMINSAAYWTRLKFALAEKPKTEQSAPEPTPEPEPEPVIIYTSEVIIPKIGVTAPLHINVLPSQVIPTLQSGVTHYADTALPGQVGNSVIFGHSSDYPWSPGQYKNIFALLDQLAIGDRITVPYTTQRFVYEVIGTKIVKPSDLSVLKKTPTPQLTLITCYPVGTAQKRLVVTAKLVEGTVTGEQTVEPSIEELPKVR